MIKYENIPQLENTCVALGYFDGLHLGHRAVIEESLKAGCTSLLFTFEPKGSRKPDSSILLSPERECMLAEMGVGAILSPPFEHIQELSPERFVGEILSHRLGAVRVACGEDYRFGKNAQGDSRCLAQLCAEHGIECAVVPSVSVDGETVSTSAVRAYLGSGRVDCANRMLGYNYGYSLRVEHGRKLGRTIGAPTINQHFPQGFFVPCYGVYASLVYVNGEEHAAVTNIGVKPTVGSDMPVSETYIHGFSQELYGETVEVRLLQFLRHEQKFASVDELRAAIQADAIRSLEIFGRARNKGD